MNDLGVEQTIEEKINAVGVLKKELEDNFVQLGRLLSELKNKKIFKFKGFKNFKEFVETKYNLSSTVANRIIGIFEVYHVELNVDESTMLEIGFDKLSIIKPISVSQTYEEAAEWLEKAKSSSIPDLREAVKEKRDKNRENKKTMKDILVEQHKERMVTFFNCSKKELDFKMALYFSSIDNDGLEEINSVVKMTQRRFEEENA